MTIFNFLCRKLFAFKFIFLSIFFKIFWISFFFIKFDCECIIELFVFQQIIFIIKTLNSIKIILMEFMFKWMVSERAVCTWIVIYFRLLLLLINFFPIIIFSAFMCASFISFFFYQTSYFSFYLKRNLILKGLMLINFIFQLSLFNILYFLNRLY